MFTFSAMALLVGWPEWHTACDKFCLVPVTTSGTLTLSEEGCSLEAAGQSNHVSITVISIPDHHHHHHYLMSFTRCKFEHMQQVRHVDCCMFSTVSKPQTVTCPDAVGKVFYTTGQFMAKLWSPHFILVRRTDNCPDLAERRWHRPTCDEVGVQYVNRQGGAFVHQHIRLEKNMLPHW